MSFFEIRDERLDLKPRSYRKRAQIISPAALLGRDEIGESVIRFPLGLRDLLAQRVESGENARAGFVGINFDIFKDAIGGEKAENGASREQLFADNAGEQLLRIVEQFFRLWPNAFLLEDSRIDSAQFPRVEKGSPVNIRNDFRNGNGAHAHAQKRRLRRSVRRPIESGFASARLREGEQLLRLRTAMFFASLLLFVAIFVDETIFQVVAQQTAHNANRARSVLHMNYRLTIHRRNFHGSVDAARGSAANKQWHVEPFALHFLGDVGHLFERR